MSFKGMELVSLADCRPQDDKTYLFVDSTGVGSDTYADRRHIDFYLAIGYDKYYRPIETPKDQSAIV